MSHPLQNQRFSFPVRTQPHSDEGPQGYLFRLAEDNLLSVDDLRKLGITFDYQVLANHELLDHHALYPELHQHIAFMSELWRSNRRIWNEQYTRFCPCCLEDNNYWRVEWEINFYDACHRHNTWLIDQCTTCGKKLTWNRTRLNYCNCGSLLSAEQAKTCPTNLVTLASAISSKILHLEGLELPKVLQETDIEQTLRVIRYLGKYMSLAADRNPLKIRQTGDLNISWPVTTLTAQLLQDWPNSFHHTLNQIYKQNDYGHRPSLNDVFGHAYHYLYKALKEKPFSELRHQFEYWITSNWKGGTAKRNKRLISLLMQHAAWVPSNLACDYLGISVQRLELLIRENAIEGEVYFSDKGRKYVMVRRDNLAQAKDYLFGYIDMKTAGKLLGLHKRRMRKLLTLVFTEAVKLGASAGSPWQISRLEVNKLLAINEELDKVSICDEDCISMSHILRYWTWSNLKIANLIRSVRSSEINPVNLLDSQFGIAAWNFNIKVLKHWESKYSHGEGLWLTISQVANHIGIKEQVAYELVSLGFIHAEVMPLQKKRGTRIKRDHLHHFMNHYIFATKVAESLSCSPRKAIAALKGIGIEPISGPQINGSRQVMYEKSQKIDDFILGKKTGISTYELAAPKSIG